MLKPLHDYVLIEVATQSSSMDLPTDIERAHQRGVVLAVGTGRTENGVQIPVSVKAGDSVRWQKFADSGATFKEDGKTLALVRDVQLVAVEVKS